MIDVSHAYLAVQAVDAEGAPDVGGSWTTTAQDAGWYTLTDGTIVIAAWRANSLSGQGLWAVYGPQAFLEALALSRDDVMPAREAWARRGESAILAWLRYWPTWRVDGYERDLEGNAVAISGVTRRLIPEGARLPDPTVHPLPWNLDAGGALTTQALAVIRVTAIHRPAMLHTMRSEVDGFDLREVMEDEPER